LRKLARASAVLAIVAPSVLSAPPANALVTCVFAAGTATITFTPGDAITVLRSGSEIHVNGGPCGIGLLVAEVTTTDTIASESPRGARP
jgi:hypothetical protein